MASSEERIAAYRIVAPRWAGTAFSGEGAQKYGGRWNSPGRRAVYLAGSRALAALEMLVHLTTPGSRAKPYVLIEAWLPADAIEAAPSGPDSQRIGDEWLARDGSLALRVPSVLIPAEPNYLLNPAHPRFAEVAIRAPADFRFDPRL